MKQIYFGERIASLRKSKGMTQEALAQLLGITNQAVSKWETDQCCPDIMQLPVLADVFGISLDALFGREEAAPAQGASETESHVIPDLPWADNNDLHAVCYIGHRLVSYRDIPSVNGQRESFPFSCFHFGKHTSWNTEPVVLEYSGNVGSIYSDYSVQASNCTVSGNVQATNSVTCGDVGGNVNAGDSVICARITGTAFAGDAITCSGPIGVNAQAGDSIRCEGMIGGNATAGGDVECRGDIGGRVQCDGDLECGGSINGDVRCDGDLDCSGNIQGHVNASGNVDCAGNITGNVTAEGDIDCSDIHGCVSAEGDVTCRSIGN